MSKITSHRNINDINAKQVDVNPSEIVFLEQTNKVSLSLVTHTKLDMKLFCSNVLIQISNTLSLFFETQEINALNEEQM